MKDNKLVNLVSALGKLGCLVGRSEGRGAQKMLLIPWLAWTLKHADRGSVGYCGGLPQDVDFDPEQRL